MKGTKKDLIKYRMERAWDTFDDAEILVEKEKWNATINKLYYSVFYAVSALLLINDLKPTTHSGAKSNFTQYFIKNGLIPKKFGKIYSQLFTWRQKGDYTDLFDFDRQQVEPYFEPVKEFIQIIEERIKLNSNN
ncbi:MAG: HEPN domain-containing protein [Bacteroidales bacterium]|nr:HEPN domain-containing protein [Bacteroidales bacterium]